VNNHGDSNYELEHGKPDYVILIPSTISSHEDPQVELSVGSHEERDITVLAKWYKEYRLFKKENVQTFYSEM